MANDNPFQAALVKGKHRGKLADRVPPASPPITPPPGQTQIRERVPAQPTGRTPPPGVSEGAWRGLSPASQEQAWQRWSASQGAPVPTKAQDDAEAARVAGNPSLLGSAWGAVKKYAGDSSLIGLMRDEHKPTVDERGGQYKPLGTNGAPAPPSGGEDYGHGDPNAIATVSPPGAPTAPQGGGGGYGGPPPGPTEQWRVGPSVRGAFGEADDAAQRAIDAHTASGQAAGQREAETIAQIQEDQRHRAEQAELKEKDRRAVLMSYQEQADTLADEAANQKIDSKRLWASKDTGEKIAGIASMVIGGFLQGLHGGKNEAADAFDREVQQDIDAQVAQMAQKGKGADRAQGLVGLAMHRFADQRAAEGAAYSAALAQAEMELKRQAALNKSQAAQDYAKDAIAALQLKRAERLSQMVAYVQPGGGGVAPVKINAKDEESARHYADKLGTEDVPGAMAALDAASQAYAPGAAGSTHGAAGRAFYQASPWAYGIVANREDVSAQQALENAKSRYIHMMTGAAAGPKEMDRLNRTLMGDGSPEAVRRGLALMRADAESKMRNHRAALTPGGAAVYDERMAAQGGGTAAPPVPRPPPPTFKGSVGKR